MKRRHNILTDYSQQQCPEYDATTIPLIAKLPIELLEIILVDRAANVAIECCLSVCSQWQKIIQRVRNERKPAPFSVDNLYCEKLLCDESMTSAICFLSRKYRRVDDIALAAAQFGNIKVVRQLEFSPLITPHILWTALYHGHFSLICWAVSTGLLADIAPHERRAAGIFAASRIGGAFCRENDCPATAYIGFAIRAKCRECVEFACSMDATKSHRGQWVNRAKVCGELDIARYIDALYDVEHSIMAEKWPVPANLI